MRLVALGALVLAFCASAPEVAFAEGGRESGKGAPLVLFVRSARTEESKAIYDAAWKALEPYFGLLSRKRLYAFDGDPKRARTFFAQHENSRYVVSFDADATALCPSPRRVVSVLPKADRREVARIARTFRPMARKVVVFGNKNEKLPGFRIVDKAVDADLAWVTEDYTGDAKTIQKQLAGRRTPLLSTSVRITGAVIVRPDPRGVGLQLAARLLKAARTGVLPPETAITRHRVVVDLDRVKSTGHRAPLPLLARADVVRRGS
jgi:hypothetical protein